MGLRSQFAKFNSSNSQNKKKNLQTEPNVEAFHPIKPDYEPNQVNCSGELRFTKSFKSEKKEQSPKDKRVKSSGQSTKRRAESGGAKSSKRVR